MKMTKKTNRLDNKNLLTTVISSLIALFFAVGAMLEIDYFADIIGICGFIFRLINVYISYEFTVYSMFILNALNIIIAVMGKFVFFPQKTKAYKILVALNYIIMLLVLIVFIIPACLYVVFSYVMPNVIMLFVALALLFLIILIIKHMYEMLKATLLLK